MFLLGAYKTVSNYKGRYPNSKRARNCKVAFYLSESGTIIKKKQGFWSFYFKKYFVRKWKKRKFICENCGNVFQGLVKSKKDFVECPKCL